MRMAKRQASRGLGVRVHFESSFLSFATASALPDHITVSSSATDPVTVLQLYSMSAPENVTGQDVKQFVFDALDNLRLLPAPYGGLAGTPGDLPLIIATASYSGYNVSDRVTIRAAMTRLGLHGDRTPSWLVVDFSNQGGANYDEMMGTTFEWCQDNTRTRSSTLASIGRRPTEVLPWPEFAGGALRHQGPAEAPLHRTRFPLVAKEPNRMTMSESQVEALLDREQFRLFNMISLGRKAEISPRQLFDGTFLGQPDRIMHSVDTLLVPIEIKPPSVLQAGTDLVSDTRECFRTLGKLSDHRYGSLSSQEQELWREALGTNSAAKAIIQVLGYACANRKKYAIITTLDDWWFLERPSDRVDVVKIAGPFATTNVPSSAPTVAKCLDYLLTLALAMPDCPSPSETPASSPAIPRKRPIDSPSGSQRAPQPPASSGRPPSGRRAAVGGRLSDYRRATGGGLRRLECPARAVVDDQEQEFLEKDLLPSLRRYLSEHSSVLEVGLRLTNQKTLSVALKSIDRNKVDRDILDQLANELITYEFLNHLQGSLIPRLYAYGCFQGGQFPFIGIECIRGHTLSSDDVPVFDQVRQAYRRLHECGVVHGDVAGRNILVTADPARPIVLIDLGLAEEAGPERIRSERETVNALLRELKTSPQSMRC
ncbi:hypothetical protein DFJ77DRAFT_513906 [Powellomyces hirtus]|nr:hypothetical protein DFJ77DRAFT_513906 [Powellomyces hirtus]